MCFWIQLSDLLGVYVTSWTTVQGPQAGTDAHVYFCHSIVQSVYDTWVSCGSASRQLTVGYLIFSPYGAFRVREQRGCADDCGWWAVGTRAFPLKKGIYGFGDPQLEHVLDNHKDTPQEKHLSVRGNFRSVCPDQEKATRAAWKSVMSELSHLITIYPVPPWPRNEDPENEREGTLQKWIYQCFLEGPLGLSRGEGNIE